MNKNKINNLRDNTLVVANKLVSQYWNPLHKFVKENNLIDNFTAFLVRPEKIVLYYGTTHLAIEYYGPERLSKFPNEGGGEMQIFDYTLSDGNFLENIVGIKFDSTSDLEMPIPRFSEDLVLPTNSGFDKLLELGWNFRAQESMFGFNTGNFKLKEGEFHRMINALFFDNTETGLKTRHVKWIDFIPLIYDDSNSDFDKMLIQLNIYNDKLVENDARYIYPLADNDDYKYSKLPRINRFIELVGNTTTSEIQLTRFLSKKENYFILSMAFLAKQVNSEVICEWQSTKREDVIPDFMVLKPDGFADIVEFKLPNTKTNNFVGRTNRVRISAEINSYISQTRVYKEYFEDPNNRNWFYKKYGYKVRNPKRTLVVGRRWNFSSDIWREISSEFSDVDILTYDDLIDGVTSQFYK